MNYDLRVLIAEIKKNFLIWLRYPIVMVGWVVAPFIWMLPFFFQGKALIGSLSSQHFADITGTEQFIPFIVIGGIVSSYIFSALWGMEGGLRMETYWGTIEYIFCSPARKWVILLGKAISNSIIATFHAFSQVLLCVLFLGFEVSFERILPCFLGIILMVIGLWGFAIALAGLLLEIKEIHGIISSVESFLYLFSPIRYPTEVRPITRIVSLLIPITYALVIIRAIYLVGKSPAELWREVLILILLDLILLWLGLRIFNFFEKRMRKFGTTGMY